MVDKAKNEFWRDLSPISNPFKPHALPEAYIAGAASDDDRLYVPFTETVSSRPLWISPSENKWCDILTAKEAGLVNRHYHPHEVFAYTISGKWGYLEHDWTATKGDFVYETPGVSGGVKASLDGGAKLSRSVNNRGGYGLLLLGDGHQNGSSMSRG
jgi:quercetin dioxygenase-like cupin family protein